MAEAEPGKTMAPVTSESSASLPVVAARLREFFFLQQRMAIAAQRGFVEGGPGWAEFAVGRAALSDAHQLSESPEGESTALLLYRSAALLFAQAHAARQQSSSGEPQASGPMQVSRVGVELAALPTEQRALVEPALAPDAAGPARWATLPDAERRLSLQGLRTLAQALGDALEAEARPVRRIQAMRRQRIGVAMALVLAAVLGAVVKLTWHPNLARNKSVVVTSAEPRVRARPRSLVDGNRRSLGFHTKNLKDQSATIDLGDVKIIHSVRVYNRIDCCQGRAVPLRLELSVDGVEYTTIERQTKSFLSWKVVVPEVKARFVRVLHEGSGFFHLAEVEVY
jgi:hypothetical protein